MLATFITSLRPEDQQKIRLAVSLRRVNPEDVPDSAKIRGSSNVRNTTKANTRPSKRTATQAGLDQPRPPTTPQTLSASSAFQQPEEVEDVSEEEIKDELYCIMTTTVVGIQYYKGSVNVTRPPYPFIHQIWFRYGWAGRRSPPSERTW